MANTKRNTAAKSKKTASGRKTSNNRKKTTAAGKKTTRQTSKNTTAARAKKNNGNEQGSSGVFSDILVILFIVCLLFLTMSVLGFGGVVGETISIAAFGTAGMMAYVLPIILTVQGIFMYLQKDVPGRNKKLISSVVFILFVCGLLQFATDGYTSEDPLTTYYNAGAEFKTGGGVIGGAICRASCTAFGEIGGVIIMVLVIIVCLILMTQDSFFNFIFGIGENLSGMAETRREQYEAQQPVRELKRELREEQFRQRQEEKRARQIKRLESQITEVKERPKRERIRNEYDHDENYEFLSGTWLKGEKVNPDENDQAMKLLSPENASAEINVLSDADFDSRHMQDLPKETGTSTQPEVQKPKEATLEVLPETEQEEFDDFTDFFEEEFTENLNTETSITEEKETEEPIIEDWPEDPMEPFPSDEPQAEDNDEFDIYDAYDEEEIPNLTPQEDIPEEKPSEEDPEESEPMEMPAHTEAEKKTMAETTAAGTQNTEAQTVSEPGIVSRPVLAKPKPYVYPPITLLEKGDGAVQGDSDAYIQKMARRLQETLSTFGVNAKVVNASAGPTVTRYELKLEMGVKVSKILGLVDDIKLNLACADIRIEAPIPGKSLVGIEVPNKENSAVKLRDLLDTKEFKNSKSRLSFAVGKDIEGRPVVTDIAKMPHVLIAGATGSGKSVCINTLIISLLYKASPEEVKLIMIDPKVVELSVYNSIPHMLIPVVTDPKKAAAALNWGVSEMMSRYNTFAEFGVRNIGEYNKKIKKMTFEDESKRPKPMYQLVIIVDELADLMMVAKGEVEDAIIRLAQLARAAGIHLVIATQRPSVDVITGIIKANMPSRIAFSVSSGVDSKTILDMVGAEKLLGKGDMLFYPQGYQKPARLQGAFVSDEEVSDIVDFLRENNPKTASDVEKEQQVVTQAAAPSLNAAPTDDKDEYMIAAAEFIIESEKASIGMLQRKFRIGFNRAARIMDDLCTAGVVGPEEGTKPRKILMSKEQFEQYKQENQ